MTRDETVAFWQQCESARAAALAEGKSEEEAHEAAKSIWNAWAGRMLEARRTLEASCQFIARKSEKYDDFVAAETVSSDPATLAWMQAAMVNFSGFVFEEQADFGGFVFPGQALFGDSGRYTGRRPGEARPPSPRAPASAKRFSTWMLFSAGRSLTSRADSGMPNSAASRALTSATSTARLGFSAQGFLTMSGSANARFSGYTNFSKASFDGVTSFSAARCDGAFTLGEAVFAKLPDLVQTSFRETPRLDNVSLPAAAFFPGLSAESRS